MKKYKDLGLNQSRSESYDRVFYGETMDRDAAIHHLFTSFVELIYDEHCCGCCWHIVLDDGNLSDENIRFCQEIAEKDHYPLMYKPCVLLSRFVDVVGTEAFREYCWRS